MAVVAAVADRNELLSGQARSIPWTEGDGKALDRAGAWVGRGSGLSGRLVDLSLLQRAPGGPVSPGGPPPAGRR